MRLPPSQLPFHSFFNLPYEYFNQSFCLNLPKRVSSFNSNAFIKIPPVVKKQQQKILTRQKQCRPGSPKSQAINALHLNHCRPTNIITNGGRKSERVRLIFLVLNSCFYPRLNCPNIFPIIKLLIHIAYFF